MKSDRQYKDSAMFTFAGMVGIIIILLILVMSACTDTKQKQDNSTDENKLIFQPTKEGPWFKVNKSSDDTINDDMMDIDMDCGDNQDIPKYESFYDVPASTDSIIIVDDILYRRGVNRWTPVYPDEYVMWIGSNGDTIWE